MGFTDIKLSGTTVTSSKPTLLPGAILSAAAEANGRPVSHVLLNDGHLPADQTWVHVDEAILKKTMNYHMLDSGLAYYTVYTSMPKAHRTFFHSVAAKARQRATPEAAAAVGGGAARGAAQKNVWALDMSSDFILDNQQSIDPTGSLILPKLFRRCTDYLRDVEKGVFDGNLSDWIRFKNQGSRSENDKVLVNGIEVTLADLIGQHNRHVSLQPDILDMVFVEK